MNSRERVLTTMNHKEPDRVPLFFNGIDAKLMRALGTGTMAEIRKRLGEDNHRVLREGGAAERGQDDCRRGPAH